jgi:hypothetical protein
MAITLRIDPEWNIIKKILTRLDSDTTLQKLGKDFIEATKITAIELVENALKYADSGPNEKQPILFSFKKSDDHVTIRVTNFCSNENQKQKIIDTLTAIHKGNPFEMYVNRMSQILEHPDGYSRLGYYRISAETEYKLNYKMTKETVTIIARRPVDKI